MRSRTTLLRTLLLSAMGASIWACSGQAETCSSCDPGDGDGDGDDGSTLGDGDSGNGDGDTGDGDTGDGDTGDGDTGDGDGDSPVVDCTNSQDLGSGFASCDEGYTHRPESPECANVLPRDVLIEWPEGNTGAGGAGGAEGVTYTTSADECERDTDCGEMEFCTLRVTNSNSFGTCYIGPQPPAVTPDYERVCLSIGATCVTDADCAQDEYCNCGALAGVCAPVSPVAGCRTDADCEGDALCLRNARSDNFDYTYALACQLPGDECDSDSDCGGGSFCSLTSEEGRVCQGESVCGRPFLVDGDARMAPPVTCSDWLSELGAVRVPEDVKLRQALAAHFTQVGLMEHASVAAFARFTLQLLSMGAPAELIEASNAAMIDETRHARLTFALASAYGGHDVGPGTLPLEHALDESSWETILEATILEGCIGETRAALEASWAAERCSDPVVRAVLEQIAEDETRHAELAWRVVTWMLQERPELVALLPRIFAEAERRPAPDEARPNDGRTSGVLNNAELAVCWEDAWSEVVLPCARALSVPLAVRTSVTRSSLREEARSR